MNALARLMLCLAIVAGGVMVESKGGGGGGYGSVATSSPQDLFNYVRFGTYEDVLQCLNQMSQSGWNWVNSQDSYGNTPLFYAGQRNDQGIIQLLKNWGAQDPGLPPIGQSWGY